MRTRLTRSFAAFLFALAVVPHLAGVTGDFTYDDKLIIRDNPRIQTPDRFPEIFTTHYFGGSLATGTAYRPLVLVTYALEEWVHGNRPSLFHLVNIALHAAVTLLLVEWLLALGFPRGPTLATGALFAVSTIHVEAVTSLVGRAEVLAALLVLLAAHLWLVATEGERLARGPYAGCLLAFLAAVFVKENAVVVPGVVVLGELFRPGRPGIRRAWWMAGLLGPLVVLFGVRRLVLKGFLISSQAGIFDLENPLVTMTTPLRVANALWLALRYIAKTYVPVGLSADHSAYALPLVETLADPRAAVSLVTVLLLVVLMGLLWRVRPLGAFGLALFFGTALPTANVLFPIGTIYAERLMYLPSAGLLAFAVGVLAPATFEVPRPARWPWREALVSAVVLAYAVGTMVRSRVWQSDQTLYADMVKKMPRSAKARYDLAFDANRRGDAFTAKAHLLVATSIFPRHYDSWALLGKLYWDEKRWDEAIAAYRRSSEIFAKYENGRWGLAKTLQESGRIAEAEAAFRAGLRELPDSYPLAYHFADLLESQGRNEEALVAWGTAVRASGEAAAARLGRARALLALGRADEALNEARWALAKDPGYVLARLFLADAYEKEGKTLAAGAELGRAFRSRPEDGDVAARLLELGVRRPETRGRALAFLPGIRRLAPSMTAASEARLAKALAPYGGD